MFYRLPETLTDELDALKAATAQAASGEMEESTLDRLRVAWGSYEQRGHGVRMVRVRTPAGAVTPAQLRGMADIAERYGAPCLHVTTRQEFQIHDLRAEDVIAVMEDLKGLELATRGGGGGTVRNVLVSPDAGFARDEVFDPSPHAFALTSRMIADPTSWQLPRKFKISFANGPRDGAYALLNDVGFVATMRDGARGFQVFVAGGAGNKPEIAHVLHDFIAESDVWLVSEAIKRVFSKYGDRENRARARLRFLWSALGEETFRQYYEAEYAGLLQESPAPFVPGPVVPVPDSDPFAGAAEPDEAERLWRSRYVESQRQAGRYSVVVPVPMGNLPNATARRLADFLAPIGDDTVRATFGQNLRLRHIPENRLGALFALLQEEGLPSDRPRLSGEAIACTGAETCKLGICRSKGLLSAILEALEASSLDLDRLGDFHLNVSGCPNACGQHLMADLGFSGGARRQDGVAFPAYTLFAGARAGVGHTRLARSFGRVPARAVPDFVVALLGLWLTRDEAPTEAFGDWVLGEGADEVADLVERYDVAPPFAEDPLFYHDWSADEPFSLKKG
ncbi:nitrite/sulfite reductase [Phaeovibrio sulfidiphilus]|uniref:Nitrite/sulfite reductase n=1 Tax=Phaeovibrio sulfidiphilus TaxID=1220600 RepID=A0A8J6YVN2_9PROT|nr:nitrite/sulfite reductase [Phaeovibrio sulfidiphilus]MBE1237259.1 nitrite/sulfite reductase [Phaeovibrio sulfidiphilus]